MFGEQLRDRFVFILCLAGFVVSALAGLAEVVPWLQSVCSSVSDGCKDTAGFTLLHLPIWLWGGGFYLLLALAGWQFRQGVAWLAAAAIGVEITLVWVMISLSAPCVFCLANLAIVLMLQIMVFEKRLLWQTVSAISLSFLLSFFVLANKVELTKLFGSADGSEVVAKVAGETITDLKLDVMLGSRIIELRKEIFKLKKERLDQMLLDRIIEKEAAARNMTLDDFVNRVILPNGVTVEEAEIDGYIQQTKDRMREWTGSYEELRNRIRSYLEQGKRYNAINAYAKSVESKYGAAIYLKEPQLPIVTVKTEGSPSLGPADAPVTIVEFSDYQCPACRATQDEVKKAKSFFGDRLRLVFKDYPLKKHKNAHLAAEAARCAGDQGRFWDYQDVLFSAEHDLDSAQLKSYARNLGLSPETFNACLDEGKYKAAVERDVEEANRIGVDRTPSFVVNGKLIVGGPSFERFQKMIEEELSKPKEKS